VMYYKRSYFMAVKQALRKKMIERIKALPTNEKQKLERILQEKLLDTDHWRQAQTIALTVSLPFEWNTSRLIKIGIKEEKQILLPISDGTNRSMTFYKINHLDHLKIGYGG